MGRIIGVGVRIPVVLSLCQQNQEVGMKGLAGKVAIVTGAGGGIGREICTRLAELGCHLAMFDMDDEALSEAANAIDGVRTSTHVVDISDYDAVGRTITDACSSHSRIDILINNAGWDIAQPFIETTPDFWDRVIDTNYKGPLNLHHHVLPLLIDSGGGKIINVSSDAGRVGSTGEAVYAGCKAALTGFGKSVAREVAKSGICINTVCPGPTDTKLFAEFAGEGEFGQKVRDGLARAIPMRRLGQPDDVAGVIVFLASDDADFITGQTISVSGGLTMNG